MSTDDNGTTRRRQWLKYDPDLVAANCRMRATRLRQESSILLKRADRIEEDAYEWPVVWRINMDNNNAD